MNIDVRTWGWNEWKAAGRHVGTYAAGGVTVAVAFNFISPEQGQVVGESIGHITSGLTELAKGIAGLVSVGYPIYNMLKAKSAAEPGNQAIAVAENLRRNHGIVPAPARKEIIGAVAKMPEVDGVVVASPALAKAIPESNVVATADELKKA